MKNFFELKDRLIAFLCDYLNLSKADGFVFGLSGGIDSAVVASLCKLTNKNCTALILPTATSSKEHLDDALLLCDNLKLNYEIINIEPILSAFKSVSQNDTDLKRIGNAAARIRMSILYDYSLKSNSLVVGTSNKSEILLGYGTIYGDLACALNPIGELYKTEVWEFARALGVPEKIINKAPSADLWPGQSDEIELGYTYHELDSLLYDMQIGLDNSEILQKYGSNMVSEIHKRIKANEFKRHMPLIANIVE